MSDTPQLDYACAAVFGPIVLDRRADRTTITIKRSTAHLRIALFQLAISVVALSQFVWRWWNDAFSRVGTFADEMLKVVAFGGACLLLGAVVHIVRGLRPQTIEITHDRLSIQWRAKGEVRRTDVLRGDLAEVAIQTSWRWGSIPFGLRMVTLTLLNGDRVGIFNSSSIECEFLKQTLVELTSLPKDTWVEAGFPMPRWHSRLSVQINPLGFLIRQRAGFPFWAILLTLAVGPTAFYLTLYTELAAGHSLSRITRDGMTYLGLIVAIIAMLALIAAIISLRRQVTVALSLSALTVSERSPFSPVLLEWPFSKIAALEIAAHEAWFRRMEVRFTDGAAVNILRELTQRDAEIMDQCARLTFLRLREHLSRQNEAADSDQSKWPIDLNAGESKPWEMERTEG